jgi:enolase-phosphatase E1
LTLPAGQIATVQAVLLDIEGTTTPVEFVSQVLFPYARERLKGLLDQFGSSEEIRADIEVLQREYAASLGQQPAPPPWIADTPECQRDSVLAYLYWLMDRDAKSTALKSLQGKIWEQGYRSGQLRSQVYSDVPPAFARWRQANKAIYIYSSGSILAQKLLFANTVTGDLTPYIRGYFDTTSGPKKDAASYRRIAAEMELPASEILFVSDVTTELDASRLSGMQTALCARPDALLPSSSAHPVIRSFDEVLF